MERTKARGRRISGWVTGTIAGAVIVTICAVLAAAIAVPRLVGATPLTILTGSMAPGMPPGTLVVVKPIDPSDIAIGTVITYQLSSGDPTVVTHRVVAQGVNSKNQPIFRTQGDANDVADRAWVRPVQIRGARWYSVPYVGYASTVLNGSQRQQGVYLVGGVLLAYALVMFGSTARDRRRGGVVLP
jgi:signal peptidase